ncbi:DUF2388 domain-containing protein [Pseudomonas sp. KB_12]|uniref:DUF2388 domain-containing protein n=1 Tax=Pseudomonas sp. KB_12 TaxID=3233034 RepID=UPI003F9947DB
MMRLKLAVATLALLSLPVGSAMADTFWRNVISSGATTGSTYLTFKDHKLIVAAQDDAGSFVASDGGIRGPYLEAAMQKVRADNPGLRVSQHQCCWSTAIASKLAPTGAVVLIRLRQ